MFSKEHSHAVCTGITAPGAQKDQPYQISSAFQRTCLINTGQHNCHIEHAEKCSNDLVCMKFRITEYKHAHAHDQQCHHKHHNVRDKTKCHVQIIHNGCHIAHDSRCTFFNPKYTIQFKQSDQGNNSKYGQKQISSVYNK